MDEFKIERRCERHSSWYCECKTWEPKAAVVPVVPPPPPNHSVFATMLYAGLGSLCLTAAVWMYDVHLERERRAARFQTAIEQIQQQRALREEQLKAWEKAIRATTPPPATR